MNEVREYLITSTHNNKNHYIIKRGREVQYKDKKLGVIERKDVRGKKSLLVGILAGYKEEERGKKITLHLAPIPSSEWYSLRAIFWTGDYPNVDEICFINNELDTGPPRRHFTLGIIH